MVSHTSAWGSEKTPFEQVGSRNMCNRDRRQGDPVPGQETVTKAENDTQRRTSVTTQIMYIYRESGILTLFRGGG